MPPYVRGGVWTNSEDEVLKAGIGKYGLNQWGRVATLLSQKTAKQAKARWFNWLDPSIKKTDWSRDEDERLLTLARLMPSQWQSIAPKVGEGRTAAQCLDRYQQLLSEAEERETGLELTSSDQASTTGAKLKSGDFDPDPENRPARPDAVDMEEDELEMLAEARARLANTQGKKAKRRERERMLDESHRLSKLQKKRELRQAGVNASTGRKLKQGEIDYSKEIPFQHKPAAGLYDTTEEQEMNEREKAKYDKTIEKKGLDLRPSDKKRKKDDQGKKESAAQQAAQARAEKLQQINVDEQISKRRKLELPAPQVEQDEMNDIIKQGKRDANLRRQVDADDLMGQQRKQQVETGPIEDDTLYKQALDIKAMQSTGATLMGDEEPELHDRTFHLPGEKPERPVREVLEEPPQKPKVQKGLFEDLPKPKNEFELALPEDEEEEETAEEEEKAAGPSIPRDRGEIEQEEARRLQIEQEKQFKRRSQAVQRGLAIPPVKNYKFEVKNGAVGAMVEQELKALLVSDSVKYSGKQGPTMDDLDDKLKAEVDFQIEQEMEEPEPVDCPSYPLPGLDEYTDHVASQLETILQESATRAQRNEDKLKLVMGGYAKRQATLRSKLDETYNEVMSLREQTRTMQNLADMEQIAIQMRQSSLHSEVEFLAEHERASQERYAYLQSAKDELVSQGQ